MVREHSGDLAAPFLVVFRPIMAFWPPSMVVDRLLVAFPLVSIVDGRFWYTYVRKVREEAHSSPSGANGSRFGHIPDRGPGFPLHVPAWHISTRG